jgi:hypothetical protein
VVTKILEAGVSNNMQLVSIRNNMNINPEYVVWVRMEPSIKGEYVAAIHLMDGSKVECHVRDKSEYENLLSALIAKSRRW